MFQTLQNRLPQELKLKGINNITEANEYLKNVYIKRHNEQFCVKPENSTPAYTRWIGPDLNEICCIQEDRLVQKDNSVSYAGITLQIPPNPMRHHFVKTQVEVRDYLNGTLSVFYGHHCLGRYDRSGQLLYPQKQAI